MLYITTPLPTYLHSSPPVHVRVCVQEGGPPKEALGARGGPPSTLHQLDRKGVEAHILHTGRTAAGDVGQGEI